jgi:hypothetical protein
MGANRVPSGWTQEAADLVWEDWACGRATMTLPKTLPLRQGTSALVRAVLDMPDPIDIACVDGAKFVLCSKVSCELRWDTPEQRIRAWCAVGAPILEGLVQSAEPEPVVTP